MTQSQTASAMQLAVQVKIIRAEAVFLTFYLTLTFTLSLKKLLSASPVQLHPQFHCNQCDIHVLIIQKSTKLSTASIFMEIIIQN